MRRCLWMCLLLTLTSPAYAQTEGRSEVERVRAAAAEFDAGRNAFTAGDFTTAAEHFENADRDAPAPEALRMAIRARMSAKQYDRVATLAASALDRYPDDKETAAFARQMLARVPKRLHRLNITCDEPCALLVDRKIVPLAESTQATVYVEPGEHDVTAGWSEGRTQTHAIEAAPGKASDVAFEAPPLPEPVDEPEEPEPEPRKEPDEVEEPQVSEGKGLPPPVFYGALGLTAVLSGVTVWSALDMRSNPGKDKVREDCAGQDESCPTYQDALSVQKRTNLLLITTGIAAVGTTLLGGFFTDWSDSEGPADETGARIAPTISLGDGVFLGANGRF